MIQKGREAVFLEGSEGGEVEGKRRNSGIQRLNMGDED